MVASQHLRRRANNETERWPSVWARGLPPSCWYGIPPAPAEASAWEVGDHSAHDDGLYYILDWWTDGSGGKDTMDPRLRMCGWGAVAFVGSSPEGDDPNIADWFY